MPFPWAIVVPAVTALANAIISSESSKKQANRINQANLSQQHMANQANMELAKYQAEQNQAYIDKQNAYNEPRLQQSRFRAAGLNPNLMYGQGNAGNQASPGQYNAPTIQPGRIGAMYTPFQIPEMLGMYQGIMLRQAQINNVEAQTARTAEQTRTEAVNRMVATLTGKRKQFDLNLAGDLRKYTIGEAATNLGSKNEQLRLLMEYGGREREAGLAGRATSQALQKVQTATMGEKLALLKQFGWTEGYQKSVLNDQNIEAAQLENFFRQNRNEFAKQGITNSDNFLVRLLFKMIQAVDKSPIPGMR